MTTTNKKYQIVESLDSLDHAQADKVLEYIKGLLYTSNDPAYYKRFKREAMKEIRQALGKGRKLNLSF